MDSIAWIWFFCLIAIGLAITSIVLVCSYRPQNVCHQNQKNLKAKHLCVCSITAESIDTNTLTATGIEAQTLNGFSVNEIIDAAFSHTGTASGASGSTGGSITLRAPEQETFISAGSFTYTPPADTLYISVQLVGGGGGGNLNDLGDWQPGGPGTASIVTDGASVTLTAGGGNASGSADLAPGGTYTITNPSSMNAYGLLGNIGGSPAGGLSAFYGPGNGGDGLDLGLGGRGGGSGAFIAAIFTTFALSYNVTVGTGGNGASIAGNNASPGNPGGVIFTAYFQ